MSNTVLITGGSGRIGRLLIARLLAASWTVAFTARSRESQEATLSHFAAASEQGALTGHVADLSDPAAPARLIESLSEGGIIPTALINNARSLANLETADGGVPSAVQWSTEFQIGVVAAHDLAVGLSRQAGSRLKSVVNVSSMYGLVAPNPELYDKPADQPPVHYGVVKAALNHLTRELAVRLAPAGIRVNAVSYGGVEGRVGEAFKARYALNCPAGDMLGEDDVPGPVMFLLSGDAGALTGHNLIADGGWTVL